MASRPKLRRMIATLKVMAVQELGAGAEPIDFVVLRVTRGQKMRVLAQQLAEAMGEPVSRSWLSWRLNRLTPEAKKRIASARRRENPNTGTLRAYVPAAE
jgi:hypothetical protein